MAESSPAAFSDPYKWWIYRYNEEQDEDLHLGPNPLRPWIVHHPGHLGVTTFASFADACSYLQKRLTHG